MNKMCGVGRNCEGFTHQIQGSGTALGTTLFTSSEIGCVPVHVWVRSVTLSG